MALDAGDLVAISAAIDKAFKERDEQRKLNAERSRWEAAKRTMKEADHKKILWWAFLYTFFLFVFCGIPMYLIGKGVIPLDPLPNWTGRLTFVESAKGKSLLLPVPKKGEKE